MGLGGRSCCIYGVRKGVLHLPTLSRGISFVLVGITLAEYVLPVPIAVYYSSQLGSHENVLCIHVYKVVVLVIRYYLGFGRSITIFDMNNWNPLPEPICTVNNPGLSTVPTVLAVMNQNTPGSSSLSPLSIRVS